MGCCDSKKPDPTLSQVVTPAFTLIPGRVTDGKYAYGVMERVNLKSFFLGQDTFDIQMSTAPGQSEVVMKVKQSAWDLGQDRMELLDCGNGDKTVAVVRRARAAMGDCFYIYTVESPYEGAKKNKWNEQLNGEFLYCFAFLQKSWGHYDIGVYYADAIKGAAEDGKDPYKIVYRIPSPGWFNPNMVVYDVAEDQTANKGTGKEQELRIRNKNMCTGTAQALVSRDRWQWSMANTYAVEVAPGGDAALFVMAMVMIDEIVEDQQAQ